MSEHSTIVGVATGTPDGGVAVVRLSGPRAGAIAGAVIEGRLPPPRTLALRPLVSLEQALVVVMPGPRSFTGEDVVELHVHAGALNVAQVVDAVLGAGAVAAAPGEFTRRAFDNRRLSLDQAEGIAAVIGAQTQAALDQARRLVAGELGREVEAVRDRVARLRIEIEANLDFPEDVDARDEARFVTTAAALGAEVERWLAGFERGRRARTRARVVIAGPPNAGKSALFNALLGRRRALVSARAGTTRDYVEAELSLGGRELILVDTAGLRASTDAIEVAGVELGREQIAGADVIVWVEGADQPVHAAAPEAELSGARGAAVIRVENKLDLGRRRPSWIGVRAAPADTEPVELSLLRDALAEAVALGGDQWIGLARHRDRAREAADALVEAHGQLRDGVGLELVALSLAVAERNLGEITGRTGLGPVGEEVLHAIFSRFCIGK
ncbi:tRNA modification GTPase MnmE [Enhygromyxa salina]|uniref:tRNA modification GTPase MnmE n=1 Tax=Enhygromyxa salina TaxID=215803 RepID=A0A2S9XRF0_9BACT|nr:tRNA modification GTPase [Enhygromyxa salina]PRP95439.1 tRNA modification GTPase MnmE [Enhygromyxa salina]